jgi:hypothetical protein
MMGYYISSWFDFIGLQFISAGLELLILFLYPSFVALINRFSSDNSLVACRSGPCSVLTSASGWPKFISPVVEG